MLGYIKQSHSRGYVVSYQDITIECPVVSVLRVYPYIFRILLVSFARVTPRIAGSVLEFAVIFSGVREPI